MEIWKKVKGFEAYEVSDRHRVRNEHGHPVTIWVDNTGRHLVSLKKDGETHRRYIAELVEDAFAPAQDAGETAEQSEEKTIVPKKRTVKTVKQQRH